MSERIVPVAETGDEVEASLWADALRAQGVAAQVVTLGPRGALGGGVMWPGASFRVVVHRESFEAARNVISDLGGAERLAALPGDVSGNPMRIAWIMAAIIGAFFGLGLLFKVMGG